MNNTFTLERGLETQKRQMVEAKRLYKPDVYAALEIYVENANKKLTSSDDGYSVHRGIDLDSFCVNWAHNNKEV